jgi:adenine-specific DNA-methyltransferase
MANERARQLRRDMNEYERKLWSLLRMKRLAGFRFRRQHPIGPYVADFFCPSAKLIVEQDGAQHFTEKEVDRDARRTRWLEERGYRVLRITNIDVLKRPFDVLEAIHRALTDPPSARQTSRRAVAQRDRGHLPPQGGKEIGIIAPAFGSPIDLPCRSHQVRVASKVSMRLKSGPRLGKSQQGRARDRVRLQFVR